MSDEEIKAGATLNRQNRTRLQSMHDMAVEMGAQCGDGVDYTPIGKADAVCPHCGVALGSTAKAGVLETEVSEATPYASMKAIGDRLIEVKVAYYGHKNGRDSHGEYFSPRTDFDPENFPAPPLLYYHGFDANGKKMGKPAVTGSFVSRRAEHALRRSAMGQRTERRVCRLTGHDWTPDPQRAGRRADLLALGRDFGMGLCAQSRAGQPAQRGRAGPQSPVHLRGADTPHRDRSRHNRYSRGARR